MIYFDLVIKLDSKTFCLTFVGLMTRERPLIKQPVAQDALTRVEFTKLFRAIQGLPPTIGHNHAHNDQPPPTNEHHHVD